MLSLLRLAELPPRAAARSRAPSAGRHRRRRDVREPRAAGAVCRRHRGRRRRGAGARAGRRACARRRIAPDLLRRLAHGPRVLRAVVLRRALRRRTARIARVRAAPARGAPPVVKKAAVKTHRRARPAGDVDLHARHRVRLALPRSRSCAAAPTCAASAGRATTTCRCGRSRPTASSSSRRRRKPYSSRAGLVSIALCDHPEIERILDRPRSSMGYSISPASLRLDDLTPTDRRPAPAERRALA